jgi:hypothetical protein
VAEVLITMVAVLPMVELLNRPQAPPADMEMPVGMVRLGNQVPPNTLPEEEEELVGRDGTWWRIRGDGAVLVETVYIFRSSPRWVTAVGSRVVEGGVFLLPGSKLTTVVGAEEAEEDGPVPRPSMDQRAQPTQEVEAAADVLPCPALRVDRVWWWWTIRPA